MCAVSISGGDHTPGKPRTYAQARGLNQKLELICGVSKASLVWGNDAVLEWPPGWCLCYYSVSCIDTGFFRNPLKVAIMEY